MSTHDQQQAQTDSQSRGMHTYDQRYAEIAYKHVTDIKKLPDEKAQKSYGSMSHKLPILIYKAGLVQALTFVDARGKEAQKKLLDDLAESLDMSNRADLLTTARTANIPHYIYLTQQALAALVWYKRFAQSILGIEASDASDYMEPKE